MPQVTITEQALLIRISQLYRPTMPALSLYEATRGVWRIGERRDQAVLAFAVAEGTVREVYEVGSWQPAGTATYRTRPPKDVNIPGRWEFTGTVAKDSIRTKYVGKSIDHYFRRGNSNPINYVNIA